MTAVAPSSDDLTLLATVKTYITTGTQDDNLLQRLLTSASVFIENYLNRDLTTTSYTQTFDGSNNAVLYLPQYPVTAVTAVTINGVTIAAASVTTPGFYFTPNAVILNGYRFVKGWGNITISWTAGYGVAGNGIPQDLEQACIVMVQYWLGDRQRNGEVSRSMGGQTISFTQKDMPPWVATILAQYKRVFSQ